MVSASKLTATFQVALPRVAVWSSRKLSAATVLGLALLALLPEQMPPFLAAASPPAPVEMVRTLPVPYLDGATPEPVPVLPARSSREAPAKILQVVAQRSRAQSQARREPESGALGKAGTSTDKGPDKAAAAVPAAPADAKGEAGKGSAGKTDPNGARSKAEPPEPDTWSDTEVIAALRDCLRRLAPLGSYPRPPTGSGLSPTAP